MKKIKDVMNSEIKTIGGSETLDNIIELMKGEGIGRLPVLDNGKVLGVVTRDDILIREEKAPMPPVIAFWEVLISLPGNAHYKERVKKLSSYIAIDLMSKKYLSCSEEDKLEDIVTKMLEEKYPYALVFREKELIGIVTKTDLIKNCF